MTITGIVLGNGFINIPEKAACAALLNDFACSTLNGIGANEIFVLNNGSLKELLEGKLNDTEEAVFAVLSAAAYADENTFASSDFCVRENTVFVNGDGEFIAAALVSAVEAEELIKIGNKRQKCVELITAQSFANIMEQRKNAVISRLASKGVYAEKGAFVSPLAEIGTGSYIAGSVRITGESRIGEKCVITGATRIKDSAVGNATEIESAVITDATVANRVTMGPFAYVRPHSVIGDGVKVGDFEEVKNATIGAGTKISHLTYVGDSDVGSGVNFGCGTVTVNYDGVHKHRTTIGDNAFIGCNTNLVSPVKVGDNAYIAAGSTVTDDIPDRSFAIARSRQTTKENYVAEKMSFMLKEKK